MNRILTLRRWFYIAVAIAVPLTAWLVAFGVLGRWNEPETSGTVGCWRVECLAAGTTFLICAGTPVRDKPSVLIGVCFAYLATSMALLSLALLTQILMLFPMDR